jgi:hypothetical protein
VFEELNLGVIPDEQQATYVCQDKPWLRLPFSSHPSLRSLHKIELVTPQIVSLERRYWTHSLLGE